ncbi:SOS response-associated peptidase [Flagellimonas aequoris]|uniref:Abasic site processing protein n=1 Tax=Flagellimonas aequoris TaxID=2306997 RepID=A0A418N4Q4_9FLAO|nr:SOS response-associated peptidase [Allomuricauda aequoris]RIV68763.1 SOS response-associated peptidase [Allomuricauda aequoris]TXK00463.1 SOS response-associated peptidase [Allomuricauda aequoris]
MCFSTSLRKEKRVIEMVRATEIQFHIEFKPFFRANGFAHPNLWIVKQDEQNKLYPATWGYVPPFASDDPKGFYAKYNTLNAKSETIFTSNTYKHSIYDKRCLILADGFHEPHKVKNVSYPYFCRYFDDSIFCFAGLYSELDDGSLTCTIITMNANEQFGKIHNVKKRQPLILQSNLEDDWLDDIHEPHLKDLMKEGFTTKPIEAYSVSRDIYKRDVDSNNHLAIDRVDYPELNEQAGLF